MQCLHADAQNGVQTYETAAAIASRLGIVMGRGEHLLKIGFFFYRRYFYNCLHTKFPPYNHFVFVASQRHVADAGDYLTFLVAGFLSFKFLVAIIVLIIVRCKKNRKTQDESSRENEHQLFPVPGNNDSSG